MDELDPRRELSLDVVYGDVDILELEAIIHTGLWRGRVRAYTVADGIAAFAAALERFTDGAAPVAEFMAGADTGIGLIGLRFYRVDRSGHIACHVRLLSGDLATDHRPEQMWRMEVEVGAEAWAVVQFTRQLAELARVEAGRATLAIEP
ncbi:MAG: hypothetical protein K2X87_20885 [Gemmataceae bacterium]|nr:hypothetical protein [Gemmataceae bacterium]